MADAKQRHFFRYLLYKIFRRNSALAHFLAHRVRPAGALLILVIPATWLIVPQYSLSPIFQLRTGALAVLCLGVLWAFCRRAKVKIQRELPRLATAGSPITYKVRVFNQGLIKLRGAKLLDLSPDNRPSYELFHHSREPGEEKRNIFDRIVGYYRWEWLQRKLTFFKDTQSSPLAHIDSGDHTTTQMSLTPLRRGVVSLQDMRICLPDPFGLFQRCRKTSAPADKLIVLPSRYRIPEYNIPGNTRFQIGGETAASAAGQSGDFTSVRDYRPGDPLRHIHWKSWARTGTAIVKEYEDVFCPRYGLLLDTSLPAEQADMFEEAVSVAASFAANIDTHQSLLDLMFIDQEVHAFSAGPNDERIDGMLQILAEVQCDPSHDFERLQKLILRYRDDLTACICIFTGWDKERSDMAAQLQRAGISLRIFSICRTHKEAKAMDREYPCPIPITWLRVDYIAQDLQQNIISS